ncbi:hypothetical protein C8Q77DRAFT_820855 [Trametes polyzona]|nr:hypothetical protein C8Q77DRAFT_820855 [Trametes polyzona]
MYSPNPYHCFPTLTLGRKRNGATPRALYRFCVVHHKWPPHLGTGTKHASTARGYTPLEQRTCTLLPRSCPRVLHLNRSRFVTTSCELCGTPHPISLCILKHDPPVSQPPQRLRRWAQMGPLELSNRDSPTPYTTHTYAVRSRGQGAGACATKWPWWTSRLARSRGCRQSCAARERVRSATQRSMHIWSRGDCARRRPISRPSRDAPQLPPAVVGRRPPCRLLHVVFVARPGHGRRLGVRGVEVVDERTDASLRALRGTHSPLSMGSEEYMVH